MSIPNREAMTGFSFRSMFGDVFRLFFPPVCPACGRPMGEGARTICTRCRGEIPLTGFCRRADNPVAERLRELKVPVVHACSFYFYVAGSGFRRLVHAFKYRGGWRLAVEMGEWFGAEMREGGLYSDVEVVVPVPLHWRKRLRRGYNQSEYLAEGMARSLGCGVDARSVVRRVHNRSQALSGRERRWENVQGIFGVRNPAALAGKHVLLVDDVLTSGFTVASCAEEILRRVPDCRLSVATLAVSRSELLTAHPLKPGRPPKEREYEYFLEP